MNEVSCRNLGIFFRLAKRNKIPYARLTEGLDYSLEHLTKKSERIDWNAFVRFMSNAGSCGTTTSSRRSDAASWSRRSSSPSP
ncbi:MAG: hypothetical protein U1F43_14915 [Myxococcota bacterium]